MNIRSTLLIVTTMIAASALIGGSVALAAPAAPAVADPETAPVPTPTLSVPTRYTPGGVAIALDDSVAYLGRVRSAAVDIVDLDTGTITGSIPLAAPDAFRNAAVRVALNPDAGLLYAYGGDQGNYAVIDTATNHVLSEGIGGDFASGMVVGPQGEGVYGVGAGDVHVLDPLTLAVTDQLDLGLDSSDTLAGAAVAGNVVFVAVHDPERVLAYDLGAHAVVGETATSGIGSVTSIDAAENGSLLVVSGVEGALFVDPSTLQPSEPVTTRSASGSAISPDGSRVVIITSTPVVGGDQYLMLIDAGTEQALTTFGVTGTLVGGIAYTHDGSRFVATDLIEAEFNVYDAPSFGDDPLPDAAAGEPYSAGVPGTAVTAVAVVSGRLPPGLTVSGLSLTGTPTEPGDFTVTLRGTGIVEPAALKTFSIHVAEDPSPEPPEGIVTLPVSGEVIDMALAPDGGTAYVGIASGPNEGSQGHIDVVDTETMTVTGQLDSPGPYTLDIVLSPDGTRLYVVADGMLRVYDTASLQPARADVPVPYWSVFLPFLVSPDGGSLIFPAYVASVSAIDTATFETTVTYQYPLVESSQGDTLYPDALRLSPDGEILHMLFGIADANAVVVDYEFATRSVVGRVDGVRYARSLVTSPDGHTLLVPTTNLAFGRVAGGRFQLGAALDFAPGASAYSPDGSLVATTSHDALHVVGADDDLRMLDAAVPVDALQVAWGPDAATIFLAGDDALVRVPLEDMETAHPVPAQPQLDNLTLPVEGVLLPAANGALYLGSAGRTVHALNPSTGASLDSVTLPGAKGGWVYALSPSGDTIYAAGRLGGLVSIDAATLEITASTTIEGLRGNAITVSPTGSRLLVGRTGYRLIDAATLSVIDLPPSDAPPTGVGVSDVTFGADDSTVLVLHSEWGSGTFVRVKRDGLWVGDIRGVHALAESIIRSRDGSVAYLLGTDAVIDVVDPATLSISPNPLRTDVPLQRIDPGPAVPGMLLTSRWSDRLRLIDPATGVVLRGIDAGDDVTTTVWAPDGRSAYLTTRQDRTKVVVVRAVTLERFDPPHARVGQGFEFQPADSALTVAQVGGELPPGLQLDPASGIISGTPTVSGSFTIDVAATGMIGPVAETSYTLTIDSAESPPPTIIERILALLRAFWAWLHGHHAGT